MKKYVFIQVRSSSRRLPFKALLNINKFPLIILLYKRIVSRSYKTVILTSNHSSDDYLCKILKKYKIKFYRGNLPNVKKRFLDYSKKEFFSRYFSGSSSINLDAMLSIQSP